MKPWQGMIYTHEDADEDHPSTGRRMGKGTETRESIMNFAGESIVWQRLEHGGIRKEVCSEWQ